MKFNFHVSPNLKGEQSTQDIMRDLTIALLVVYVSSCAYYFIKWGTDFGLHCISMMISALMTVFVCESLFAKFYKKNIKKYLLSSFGWVTGIILVLMVPVTMTNYAIVIATAFAIVCGKLMFGGFGHNIFNPAGVGRAVIFASFSGVSCSLMTGATPISTIANTYHWLPATNEAVKSFVSDFGGFKGLALGTYPGGIGETFTILILICGVILALRKVIDWRIPVVYLGGIFVMTAVIALIAGLDSYNGMPAILWYPCIHILTGGAVFGAVFMLTDPVTSPTSAAGRTWFALGAAILTVLIRTKANLPEGCLYSILLMNMFTPMIESSLDGKQLELKKKALVGFISLAIVGLAVSIFAATSITPSNGHVAIVEVQEMGDTL